VEILYPESLKEQKQIVATLDEAFEAINQAKANTEKNLHNAKELFQSELNRIFIKAGEGYGEKKLGEVCSFVRGPFGGSLKKEIFKPSGIAVYEQQHAIYNQFTDIRYFIDDEKFNEMKRFELLSGDLIMSCSGTMGKVAIVPEGIQKGIINQALLKLTPNKNLLVEYLKFYMESVPFQFEIAKNSLGAAIQNVASVSILKQINIPFPNIGIQGQIVNQLETLLIETKQLEDNYRKKLESLEELKKSILQKAFSGELTCKIIDYELSR
jgi:type I restriction enzyme S subunit